MPAVVVLNLQPAAQLDYEAFNRLGDRGVMTGVWLEHSQSCPPRKSPACSTRRGSLTTWSPATCRTRTPGKKSATGSMPRAVAAGHAWKPRRRAGTLLLRNARRVQRPDPAVGRVRQPLRVARNVANCTPCARLSRKSRSARSWRSSIGSSTLPRSAKDRARPAARNLLRLGCGRKHGLGSMADYYEGEERHVPTARSSPA